MPRPTPAETVAPLVPERRSRTTLRVDRAPESAWIVCGVADVTNVVTHFTPVPKPSAILRAPSDEERRRERRRFVADLVVAAQALR